MDLSSARTRLSAHSLLLIQCLSLRPVLLHSPSEFVTAWTLIQPVGRYHLYVSYACRGFIVVSNCHID